MTLTSRGSKTEVEYTAADLLAFATRLTMGQDSVEVSKLVADTASVTFGANRVSVGLLCQDDPTRIEIVALSGVEGALRHGDRLPVDELVLGEAIHRKAPVEFDPEERTERDAIALRELGIRRCLLVPLLSGSHCLGSLNIATTGAEIDVDIASQLGRLLGSQLDRIAARTTLERQLTEQRRDTQRWQLLRRLESELSASESLDDLLLPVAAVIGELVNEAHVSFVEVGTGSAIIHMADGERRETLISLDDPAHAPLLERFGSGTAHYVPDLASEEVRPFSPELLVADARSVLCVSVDGRGGPVGALIISSPRVDGILARDREMLDAVAPMVGSALEQIEVGQRLALAASHDHLTGLIRRDAFDALLDDEVNTARQSGQPSSVVSIDVDRFKVVNDLEGHLVGDEFLVEVAARLQRALGANDVATRVGADEFAVLLRGRERDDYEALCTRLVQTVSKAPFFVGERSLFGTISVGFAIIDAETPSGRDALALADAACYSAKMAGGNRARPANEHDSRQSARRTASKTLLEVRRAIDEDRLTLYGQPIYDLADRSLSGFEVLVRMHGPDGDLIPPDRFLPIAERYHIIDDLDAWVVRRALFRLSRCAADAGDPPRLFINLSPTSITSTGFADRIEAILAESEVTADRLCFEITETGTMKSFDEALSFVKRISSLGARVALDDFGVGLSSLSHLQSLPIDVLKIDGSLVVGIENDGVNAAMVSTIQALADALGLTTIAEFVENEQAVAALNGIGVHCGQGYHLGRPEPLCDQLTGVGFGLVAGDSGNTSSGTN